jgi:integrase
LAVLPTRAGPIVVCRGPAGAPRWPPPAADERRFRTKKQAEAALADALSDLHHGVVAEPSRIKLGEYLDAWLASVTPSLRLTAALLYRHAIDRWIKPRLGGLGLNAVTPDVLDPFYAELSTSDRQDGAGGLGSRSVRLAHQVLHKALGRAAARGRMPANPATSDLSLPRQKRPTPASWSAEQARRFLAATADHRLAALWQLMISTGLRRGETLGLAWTAVDLDAGRLAVVQALVVAGGTPIIAEPKTATGRRTVTLHPRVVGALRPHRRLQTEERLLAGPDGRRAALFRHRSGRPLPPRNVLRHFYQVTEFADLPRISIHDLRHAAATLALETGVHPKLVSEMLGHARSGITLDLYSHATADMHADATAKIGRALFGD